MKNPIIVLTLATPKPRHAPLRGSKAFERGMSCFDDILDSCCSIATRNTLAIFSQSSFFIDNNYSLMGIIVGEERDDVTETDRN